MSKIEIRSIPKATKNKHMYRSAKYMAFEALKNKFQIMIMCPFKANVYSFAMVCCKRLSKKDSFCVAYKIKSY